MCSSCHVKPQIRYEGKTLILTPTPCHCKDCGTVEYGTETRCIHCDHMLEVVAAGVNDSEDFEGLYVNPRTKHPVRLDELSGQGLGELEVIRGIEELRRKRGYPLLEKRQ